MNRFTALTLGALMLASCNGKNENTSNAPTGIPSNVTTVLEKSTDVNGTKQHFKLVMSQYAVRAALGNNPNTAAYVTIKNEGNQPDRLISAACTCAAKSTLHTMSMNGSVMEMAEMKDGFPLAVGDTLTLTPGGNHIMLEGLTTRPQDGAVETVTLTFEKAGSVPVTMPVFNAPLAKAGAADEHAGMKAH